MTAKHSTDILTPEQLSGSKLSSLIDLLLSQEEYLRDELLRVKRLRVECERLIPDSYNHLREQINEILKD